MKMNRQRGALLGLIAIVGFAAFLMALPFLGYILAGVILGFVMYPLQRGLTNRMGGTVAASLLIATTMFAAVLPVLVTVGLVYEDARSLIAQLGDSDVDALRNVELFIADVIGQPINIEEGLQSALESISSMLVGSAGELITALTTIGIGLTLMLFIQYYVLKDGGELIEWTKTFDIMPTEMQDELYKRTANTTWAVIKGHIFVAVIQGLIAGIGLFAVGIPNAVFWTFIMVLLGFIPIIGSMMVWAPAGGYLILQGSVVEGVLLLLYGFTVVGLTDNIVRPLLVDRNAAVHPVFILIGVVGGVFLFGAVGIFIGPILFGILRSLLVLFRNNYSDL